MHVKGKLVTLRAPEPSDLPLLNQWANDPDLWHYLVGWHFPYSMASTARWIEARSEPNQTLQVWCIDTPDAGVVGTTTLENIDWKNRSCNLGMAIGSPKARGKGYALDAAFATLRFAFDEMGMNRIEGFVLDYNEASSRMFSGKVGFVEEGRRRQAIFKGGTFHDLIVYGMTRDAYSKLKSVKDHWGA